MNILLLVLVRISLHQASEKQSIMIQGNILEMMQNI